jgi:hypothetical protein
MAEPILPKSKNFGIPFGDNPGWPNHRWASSLAVCQRTGTVLADPIPRLGCCYKKFTQAMGLGKFLGA